MERGNEEVPLPGFQAGSPLGTPSLHFAHTKPSRQVGILTREQGGAMMLRQQENAALASSHKASLYTLEGASARVNAGQPVLILQVGSHLDPGLRRKHEPNEDTLFVTNGVIRSALSSPKPFVLLVVADGMGGQVHGQEASRLAVASLVGYVSESLQSKQVMPDDFLPLLKEGVESANQAVYQSNQEQGTNMGTTMTAALFIDTTAYVAHVGDSRCYLYRKPAGLVQITQDHSIVAALAAAGIIQPADIYTHPRRNLIYRCLGEKATVEVDGYPAPLAAGDILLLCSDGLWEMVRDPQIASILTTPAPNPSWTAHALIQAALAAGGEDNVCAIVAQVSNM
jgi:serine/threonine protein phosphatase PrpC